MKKYKYDIIFWLIVALTTGFLAWAVSVNAKNQERRYVTKVYELVDKTTEVRTHRYLMVENAIKTDHILVWKSETGRVISVEASRNSYYNYEHGKRYRFKIDPERSEKQQIEMACQ